MMINTRKNYMSILKNNWQNNFLFTMVLRSTTLLIHTGCIYSNNFLKKLLKIKKVLVLIVIVSSKYSNAHAKENLA